MYSIRNVKYLRIAAALGVLLVIVFILMNVRVVTVSTSEPSSIKITKSFDKEDSAVSDKTTKKTAVIWGREAAISAQVDNKKTQSIISGGFILNPLRSVYLDIKPQLNISRTSSLGDNCLLGVNKNSRTALVSDCNQDTMNRIRAVTEKDGNAIWTNIAVTSLGSSPITDGFVYNVQNNNDSYAVWSYLISSGVTEKILDRLEAKPIFVTNSQGKTAGVIVGDTYHPFGKDVSNIKLNVDGVISTAVTSNENTLIVLTATGQPVDEDHQDIKESTYQLLSYNTSSGDLVGSYKVKSTPGLVLLPAKDGAILSSATDKPTITNLDASLRRKGVYSLPVAQPPSRIISTDSGDIIYINDGMIWKYSTSLNISSLIYSASDVQALNLTNIGGAVYAAAGYWRAGSFVGTFNFEILDSALEATTRNEQPPIIASWSGSTVIPHEDSGFGIEFITEGTKDSIFVSFSFPESFYKNPNYLSTLRSRQSAMLSYLKDRGLDISKYDFLYTDPGLVPSHPSSRAATYSPSLSADDDYTGDGVPPEEQPF